MIEDFAVIEAAAKAADDEVERLSRLMERLTRLGMWPRVPREEWQSRGARENAYLYMVFAKGPNGRYSGPGGSQKVYVGCDVSAIVQAQEKTTRRVEWEALERKLRKVKAGRAFLSQKLAVTVALARQVLADEWDSGSQLF